MEAEGSAIGAGGIGAASVAGATAGAPPLQLEQPLVQPVLQVLQVLQLSQQLFLWWQPENKPNSPQLFFLQQVLHVLQLSHFGAAQAGSHFGAQQAGSHFGAQQAGSHFGAAQAGSQAGAHAGWQQLFLWQSNSPFRPSNRQCFLQQGSHFGAQQAGSHAGAAQAGSHFGAAQAGSHFGAQQAGSHFGAAQAGSHAGAHVLQQPP